MWAFSSCGKQGLLSCGVWASHCGGFSCWQSTGSVVVVLRLSCPVAHEIFPDHGSNPHPLHWQVDSQPLYHQGSPEHDSFFIHSFTDGHGLFSPFGYYKNGAVYSHVHEPFSFNVLNSHSLCLVNEGICHKE